MKFIGNIITAFILIAGLSGVLFAQTDYQKEVERWREQRETDLKSENSWLSLAGLFWLKEGANTIGSGVDNDIKLPAVVAEKVGVIEFKNGVASLAVNEGVKAVSDGKAVGKIELKSDENASPTLVELGDVNFTIIKREDRFGVRVKDKNNINRQQFKGLHWFPIDESYRLEAEFEAYNEPKEIEIPNVLGSTFKMKSPGILRFKIKGQEYSLVPVEEGDKLFIIFSDLTAKTTTYQSGRFLYSERPQNGKVVLDFNEAYNPPCAFTEFATCPLPPAQNRLKVEIEAGEKRYDH